jgi:hypothetical protein
MTLVRMRETMSRRCERSICPKRLLVLLCGSLIAGWAILFFPWLHNVLAQSLVEADDDAAYFQFDYLPYPETFIFKLTDPHKIEQARQMLAGQIRSQHIMGEIVKSPEAYNPSWSYHLEPGSVDFFDFAIEVCDASIQQVEANLGDACGSFLPGCEWCPWGSRLLAEVAPPLEAGVYLPVVLKE